MPSTTMPLQVSFTDYQLDCLVEVFNSMPYATMSSVDPNDVLRRSANPGDQVQLVKVADNYSDYSDMYKIFDPYGSGLPGVKVSDDSNYRQLTIDEEEKSVHVWNTDLLEKTRTEADSSNIATPNGYNDYLQKAAKNPDDQINKIATALILEWEIAKNVTKGRQFLWHGKKLLENFSSVRSLLTEAKGGEIVIMPDNEFNAAGHLTHFRVELQVTKSGKLSSENFVFSKNDSAEWNYEQAQVEFDSEEYQQFEADDTVTGAFPEAAVSTSATFVRSCEKTLEYTSHDQDPFRACFDGKRQYSCYQRHCYD